jgi:hypothetical protein
MKNITNSDPRKPVIVAALKAASNCRRITLVRLDPKTGLAEGNCLHPNDPGAKEGFMFVLVPGTPPPPPVDDATRAALLAATAAAEAAVKTTYKAVNGPLPEAGESRRAIFDAWREARGAQDAARKAQALAGL